MFLPAEFLPSYHHPATEYYDAGLTISGEYDHFCTAALK
ncbi:hypothetical protein [Morganella morganii IS15]|nr:hypothetical protein CSB69_3516 [Morganella morganii]EMP52692.1 hypothetical protein C790_03665 [Morganella morganii SC01]CDK67918.1 hypothetical protein [Morganella morganii IS15]